MGEKGIQHQSLMLNDEEVGAAANNPYATSSDKIVNPRAAKDSKQDPGSKKSKSILQRIEESLLEDPYILELPSLQMQHLGDLQKMTSLTDLAKIDISKNYLDNIDALNDLHKLKVIIANNNYIRNISLQLPKLQELDLGNNYIDKVPILSQMPLLKILILNANSIRELKLTTKPSNLNNIMKMVFSHNNIRFTNMEVINFVKTLKEFKSLRVINLEGNPFEKDAVINAKIIRNLPQSLEMYNNQKKVYVQSTITMQMDDVPAIEEDHDRDGAAQEGKQPAAQRMPTLENLLYNLEAANSHPNKALTFLKQLYVDADKIKLVQSTQSQSVFVQSFTKSKDTHTIRENIETFMQHAQLLVDNHFELRNIILSILSKLTVIRSYDFGVKCFYTLRDLMVSGKELERQVMDQLNQNVIRELGEMSSSDIPVSILIGLKDLVEKQQSHETNLMSQLFERFFPKWLSEIKQKFAKSKGGAKGDDESEQTDAVFALLTASLRDNEESVMKMYEERLHDMVADIFLKTSPQKSRYLHLLESMNEIAKFHKSAASDYIDKFVHREILQEIKLTFYKYKKAQELVPEDNKDNISAIAKMYRIFSAQIDLIASLLNADRGANKILNEGLVSELLNVLTHSSTDPILLTSLCYLAERVLSSEMVKSDPANLGDKINRMQSCEGLVPYLGMAKYEDLVRNSQKYNSDDQVLVQDTGGDSLMYQNDPIIHNTFIKIIKLIEYFTRENALMEKALAEDRQLTPKEVKIMHLLSSVTKRLNDTREEALFKVLVVPNDDVRLAVVGCLYYVPIRDIDGGEIDKLLKMMSPQNVGAGKTELVLAVVYNILSNLISDTDKKSQQTTTLFKTKFSFTAISMAIQIMIKNQERVVEEADEEEEKFTLGLAILNFLKHVSNEVKTKDQLKSKGEVLKRLLYAEQNCTRAAQYFITPVEVEVTQMGMDFESLRGAIQQGHLQIEPYNYISFRILHQMANLLQQQWPDKTYDPIDLGEQESTELIDAYKKKLDVKKEYEDKFWELTSAQRQYVDEFDEKKKEIKMHHKVFTKKNGVKGILHYLTAQQNFIENWLRINSDPAISHAGALEKHPLFGRGLKYQLLKKFRKARKKLDEEAETAGMSFEGKRKKSKAKQPQQRQDDQNNEKKREQREQQMRTFMRNEMLGSGYMVSDTDLFISQRKPQGVSLLMKQREFARMGIQNPQLRSLCISAFLRCLYASIDSAPDGEYQRTAIDNLKSDKVFTQITQLCASTGWLVANIGSKYLQVMRYIIRVEPTKRLEEQDNLLKYEILSIVIKRILGLLKEKIKNVNNNLMLEMSDRNLLTHLAVVSYQMVTQCSLFHWCQKKDNYKNVEQDKGRELRFELIDKLMSQLFPLDEVQLLVDVIFQEMDNASKRIHGGSQTSSPEEEHKMRNFGNSILDNLGKFFTEYLAYCKTNQFHIIQYLTSIMVCDTSKKIRTPFLEGMLEGANQIQVSRIYIEQMIMRDSALFAEDEDDGGGARKAQKSTPQFYTLAYKRSYQIREWMNANKKNAVGHEVELKQKEQLQVDRDCFLGERIVFTYPMPVHIKKKGPYGEQNIPESSYKIILVMITNQGLYLIDDEDQSCNQNPESDGSRPNLRIPDQKKVERFSFTNEIKKVFISEKPTQRLVIFIDREVEQDTGYGLFGGMFGGKAAATPTTAATDNGDVTHGGDDEEVKSAGSQSHRSQQTAAAKPGRTRGRKERGKATEKIFVTLVLPNTNDSLQLRTIFKEALEEDEEHLKVVNENLLNYTILMETIYEKVNEKRKTHDKLKQGCCPFCAKLRIFEGAGIRKCTCDYFTAYAFKIEAEQTLKLITKSKHRGGPARLLTTSMKSHCDNLQEGFADNKQLEVEKSKFCEADLGILLVSHTGLYFFKEDPSLWEVREGKTEWELKSMFEQLRKKKDQQAPLLRYLTLIDVIELKALVGLSVINGRIPAIEISYKDKQDKTKNAQKWFSMLSDANVQDTLHWIRQAKKVAYQKSQENDDD